MKIRQERAGGRKETEKVPGCAALHELLHTKIEIFLLM